MTIYLYISKKKSPVEIAFPLLSISHKIVSVANSTSTANGVAKNQRYLNIATSLLLARI